jgi:predicted RNA-binding Zn-ribbon protein involved in translation (DUF1610 family)
MNENEIKQILKDIVKNEIKSQKTLKQLIRNKNRKLRISYKKLRKICLESGIKIKMEIKRSQPKENCPCCGNKLKKFYIKSLKDELILIKLKCNICGFTGYNGKFGIRRYIFQPPQR